MDGTQPSRDAGATTRSDATTTDSDAEAGERPLMHATECKNGSFAGIASCVKNPAENGCGWLVTDCNSGG